MLFRDRLRHAMQATQSLVCVGLDPQKGEKTYRDIVDFNTKVV